MLEQLNSELYQRLFSFLSMQDPMRIKFLLQLTHIMIIPP
jgi:hypothetical protein